MAFLLWIKNDKYCISLMFKHPCYRICRRGQNSFPTWFCFAIFHCHWIWLISWIIIIQHWTWSMQLWMVNTRHQHQTTRKSWWWLIVRNQFVDVIMLSWSRIAVNYHTYHIRHCKLCEQFKLWNCQMTVNAIIFASGFRDASK